MSFDPTKPAANSEMRSEEMREQLNGLKTLIDDKLPAAEKGAANGVASLDASGRVVQPADFNTLVNKPLPAADGTYTVGIGTVQNGTITVVGGIITGIQEASNTPPAPASAIPATTPTTTRTERSTGTRPIRTRARRIGSSGARRMSRGRCTAT